MYNPRAGTGDAGGTETFIREIAKQLSDSHEITLYTGEGDVVESIRSLDIEITQIPTIPRHQSSRVLDLFPLPRDTIESALMYLSCLRHGVFDDMQSNLDVLTTFLYFDGAAITRSTSVPTIHRYWGLPGPSKSLKVLTRLSRPDLSLANTESTRSRLSEWYDIEVDGVVNPGVDTEQFRPELTPAFETDDVVILFVGRFKKGKGLNELIEAFDPIADDSKLYLVGDGQLRQDIEADLRSRGLEDRVVLTGTVPHERIPHYYAAADIFCLPSYYEAFGLSNIEAMACGKPVVTSCTATEGYITDEENGVLVQPRDTKELQRELESLIESPQKRKKLGKSARQTALKYSWQQQAAKMEEYYQTVVTNFNRSS